MIYFIQDTTTKAIKIGYSADPSKRLATLQTAHPGNLRLLGVIEGSQQEERELHERFMRKRGEWFEPTEDLLVFIRERLPTSVLIHSNPMPMQFMRSSRARISELNQAFGLLFFPWFILACYSWMFWIAPRALGFLSPTIQGALIVTGISSLFAVSKLIFNRR